MGALVEGRRSLRGTLWGSVEAIGMEARVLLMMMMRCQHLYSAIGLIGDIYQVEQQSIPKGKLGIAAGCKLNSLPA